MPFRCLWLTSLLCIASYLVRRGDSTDASPNCDGILLNVLCPVLCVADLSICSTISRNCSSPDLHLCPDGKCRPGPSRQQACADVSNLCHCHSSSPIACARPIIGVSKSTALDEEAIRRSCFARFNTSSSNQLCPSNVSPHHVEIQRIQTAIYYALIGFGLYAFLLTGWAFWRSAAISDEEGHLGRRLSPSGVSAGSLGAAARYCLNNREICRQLGYRDSLVGSAILYLGVAGTLAVFAIGIIICCYYYRFVDLDSRWIEEIPFDDLSISFIIIWNSLLAWLLVVKIFGQRLRSLFRLPAAMKDATFIDIQWVESDYIDIVEGNSIVQVVHKFRTWLRNRVQSLIGSSQYCSIPVRCTPNAQRYIMVDSQRLILDKFSGQWEPVNVSTEEMNLTYKELAENFPNGISSIAAAEKLDIEGPNSIEICMKTQIELVAAEFFKYSYLYQCGCLAVECYMSYWIIACIHICAIVIVGVIEASLKHTRSLRMQKYLSYWGLTNVAIIRDGKPATVLAKELVLGDIVSLDDLEFVPFDGVVLSGKVAVDEAALSGDPVPKVKEPYVPASNSDIFRKSVHGPVDIIFAGSTIVHRDVETGRNRCLAVVVDKGVNTTQGRLIQASLRPKRMIQTFTYELEVAYFILVAWSVISFFVTLTSVVIIQATVNAWFYGVFTLCNIIIPLLPTFLKFGQIQSYQALKERGVLTNFPERILTAAKVRIFAFDKTGTLTNSGFVLFGIVPVINGVFIPTQNRAGGLQIETIAQNMACAHCLSICDSGEPSGTDIDMELFRITGWSLTRSNGALCVKNLSGDKVFTIIRLVQHNNNSMRMCSIVRDNQGIAWAFLKGAPESISSIVSRELIPSNFSQTYTQYAREGYYTLACAYKILGIISDTEINSMNVEEMERNCNITCLLLFQNTVRPESARVIKSLREADIRPIILTGDNLFTACHVAEQLELIQHDDVVLFADLNNAGCISWTDLKTARNVSLSHVLKCIDAASEPKCELAVSGPAFRILTSNGGLERLLFHIRVFATLSSLDKKNVINALQRKAVVAMCGNGGNDCEALQVAHVGVGLKDDKTKFPFVLGAFSSSLTSCIDLILCGRSALRTNHSLYNFSMIYGETLLWAGFIGYALDVVIPIVVWAFVDGPVLLGIAAVIAFSRPNCHITGSRPTARLFGPTTLLLIVGSIAINILFACLAIVLLYQQDFLECSEFISNGNATVEWWNVQDNAETAVLSIVVMFQCIFSGLAAILYVHNNKNFRISRGGIFFTASLLAFLIVMVLSEPNRISCLMRVNCGNQEIVTSQLTPRKWDQFNGDSRRNVLPFSFRTQLVIFCLLNGMTIVGFHIAATRGPIKIALQKRFSKSNRLKLKI